MTNFTPGPWSVDSNNGGGGSTISAPSADRIVHTNEVAKVNNSKGRHVTSAEAKANAMLVAAAPGMLEALKTVVSEGWLSGNSLEMACREIIAKAEGKTN